MESEVVGAEREELNAIQIWAGRRWRVGPYVPLYGRDPQFLSDGCCAR
jgi:hypothetical protein